MELRIEKAGEACTQAGEGEGRMAFEQQPRETSRAYAAFKVYLDMGPERSLSKTAKEVGKKLRLMEYWSRKWDWQGRIQSHQEHTQALERKALEIVAAESAVNWAIKQDPVRQQAWQKGEHLIALAEEIEQRWRESDKVPDIANVIRALDLAFKLKQFAAGMPREIKEINTTVTGKIDMDWELAIKKAYAHVAPAIDVRGGDVSSPSVPDAPVPLDPSVPSISLPPPTHKPQP